MNYLSWTYFDIYFESDTGIVYIILTQMCRKGRLTQIQIRFLEKSSWHYW